MSSLPFIFSNQPRWKYIRHVSFWAAWLLLQLLLYSFTPAPTLIGQTFLTRLMITLPDTLLFLIPQMFLAYTLMYLVIPRLVIPGKYLSALAAAIFLVLATGLMSAALSVTIVDWVRYAMARNLSPVIAADRKAPMPVSIGIAVLAGLRGGMTIGGIAAAIKLMKCFYEQQQAALILEKEKVNAELQTLKAQLHPHFLFNTLNNIYSLTQEVSDKASGMVMELSAILRYILYDCNKTSVPLDKELQMIRDYIRLEAIRYDQTLDLSIDLPGKTGANIAPLLLLPFVENAFKHGASNMIERPWITIAVTLNDHILTMKLVNGKQPAVPALAAGRPPTAVPSPATNPSTPVVTATPATSGIGIANVQKRLELLYPQKHNLQISEEEDIFIVNVRIELKRNEQSDL